MKKIFSFVIIFGCSLLVFGQKKLIEVPEPVKININEIENFIVDFDKIVRSTKTILFETENGDTVKLDDFLLLLRDGNLDLIIYQNKNEIYDVLEYLNFDYFTEVKLIPAEKLNFSCKPQPKDGWLSITTKQLVTKRKKKQKKSDIELKFFDINEIFIKAK